MKLSFPRALAPIVASALFVTATLAAQPGYSGAIVSADARWVIHADLNSLRASELGKELVSLMEKAQLEAGGGKIGLNIPKLLATIGSLTAYGSNLSADPDKIDGALIAQGTLDLRKIAESVMLQGTLAEPDAFSEVTDLPFPAYAISDPKAPEGKKVQLVVAFPPEPIVIVSKSKAQLIKARDVFRGSAPSLAKGSSSPLNQLAANATGAYLFAASVVPTEPIFPEKAPQARILQLVNSGSLAFGERSANLFAHAELAASSDKNAEKLMKILEGMTSMLSLAESKDEDLAEFLKSTAVTREKDVVTLKLAYPTARIAEMAQTLRRQAEAKPAQRPVVITAGKTLAEWPASDVESESDGLAWRTIENITLANGQLISLGRAHQGGRDARFDRVEIIPSAGGAPLVFRHDFMRQNRSMLQFPFPGTDGTYTLKVAYVNDPERKTKFAVSVQDPKTAPAAQPKRSGGPVIPESKSK